ncbi:MAG: B12-binding domain-containing radical SAM protein [Deltaproteobacteria bacterium]|nr:B12-binding domain-containing radical SAM protein [Deltaproteobacteria bacterium]
MATVLLALLGVGFVVGGAAGLWRLAQRRRLAAFRRAYVPPRVDPPNGGRRRKVLIISTTPMRLDGSLIKQSRLWLPALNVALLAALTPPDWDVEIVYETIEDVPLDTDADLVAISGMGVGLWRGARIADELRRRGKTVVMGGPMATLVPDQALEHCDAVCVGEGEPVWERMLRDFERGELQRRYEVRRPAEEVGKIGRLGGLPVPRYDLLAEKAIGFWLPVQVGRGCPYHCDFCSIAAEWQGHYVRRDLDEVERDVGAAKAAGFDKILVIDDNISGDPRYALDLFAVLKRQRVRWMSQCALSIARQPELLAAAKASGCTTLSFGLETLNQESLDSVGKKFVRVEEYREQLAAVRAAGIDVSTEMMLGLDGDGPDTFDRIADFVVGERIAVPRFYIVTPIPGTPLHQAWEREGRIVDRDPSHYTAAKAVFTPRGMTTEELDAGYWRLYERTFTLGAIIKRFFLRPPPVGFLPALFLLGANLQYRSHIKKRICPGIV